MQEFFNDELKFLMARESENGSLFPSILLLLKYKLNIYHLMRYARNMSISFEIPNHVYFHSLTLTFLLLQFQTPAQSRLDVCGGSRRLQTS